MNKIRSALVIAAVMSCVLIQSADALIHVVGGSCGWEVPPKPDFFAEWAKPRTFGVGDKLVFPYRVGAHTVIQVPKEDFDKCGHDHVIAQFYKGPTILELNNTGDYYFYSGVGTHCEMGEKLHIVVGAAPGTSGRVFTPPRRLLLAIPVLSNAHAPILAEGPALPEVPATLTETPALAEVAPHANAASASLNAAHILAFVASCFLAIVLY